MLESAVARILNGLLGKYVVDLDTENLNVGIFSGQVQLTDLKLKTEALYELDLPIYVRMGSIGKISLQIPWSALWNQPVLVHVEDVHIVTAPIIGGGPKLDAETNKRLLRALKRQALATLLHEDDSSGSTVIGGPAMFADHLLAGLVHNLQLTISNVHVKYEDTSSGQMPLVAGLCIGTITAEPTNSKWKACNSTSNLDTSYYVVKVESLLLYWNPNCKPENWDLPSQYYQWRNSMSTSLQNFTLNGKEIEFLIKPMTVKIKMTITKSRTDNSVIRQVLSDCVIHDCNVHITKQQYDSIVSVSDALSRAALSWPYLSLRPVLPLASGQVNGTNGFNGKSYRLWWKYAYEAVLEQRVRPYTWSRVHGVREKYRKYAGRYAQILSNPNDSELKVDLQLLEDELSIVNVVIARQQARLMAQATSTTEKSFWEILPSPERNALCKKIGFKHQDSKSLIDYTYNFRIGNTSLTLLDSNSKEVLLLTMTQLISSLHPNRQDNKFSSAIKVEALIIEVTNNKDQLVPILSTENNGHDRAAYFFKLELEKNAPLKNEPDYKVNSVLEYLEVTYDKYAYEKILKFFHHEYLIKSDQVLKLAKKYKSRYSKCFNSKFIERCDLSLDIKVPYVVLPQSGSITTGENILVLDLGRIQVRSELCLNVENLEEATQMELEEQLYSRFYLDFSGMQILFCENVDGWRAGRNEKDTVAHVLPKLDFTATYAKCIRNMKTLPNNKINFTFPLIKLNFSERKMITFLKFYNSTILKHNKTVATSCVGNLFERDVILRKITSEYLGDIQKGVRIADSFTLSRKHRDTNGITTQNDHRRLSNVRIKENINEVWARCVDLPGLEDNISPNNTIRTILHIAVNEFQLVFHKSSENSDRQYLTLRMGFFTMDLAWMTFGPALQITLNNILLTDKLHTTTSGQYLDLVYSPLPSKTDVVTILFRKVVANCPDFWTHFHGVETSLVADLGTINLILHQESIHTLIKYSHYFYEKIMSNSTKTMKKHALSLRSTLKNLVLGSIPESPVPPGSIKFSQSARLTALNIRVCDSDYEIVHIQLSEYEVDFLFRANERFIFRSFLSNVQLEHLSEDTLYTKVLSTDQDKVFEVKYVKFASNLNPTQLSPATEENAIDGSVKFQLGQLHITFIYKLLVQLQRFVVNLEAIPYIQKFMKYAYNTIAEATESLKTSTKMNLAISVKGPALLFPQKSLSPNVIIIDTGNLVVENFFKETPSQNIENILFKLNGITVSRGVMMLNNTLQLQETIIEAVNLHLDIKRHIKPTGESLCWEIDGLMDNIVVTLGQRDITTILSVLSDNIGEGYVSDLFPETIASEICEEPCVEDETVRNLEAFFGEPRQKLVSAKFSVEGINLSLFFDSGELLSSPIRDLNHGLCKYEVCSISTSFTMFGDSSVDGKLSIETVFLEEIGPDANNFDRRILYSPQDETARNSNCNIAVFKPPVIDITFHKSSSVDKSIDVIIGRLCLSLSVPFCEKIAIFVTECIPRDSDSSGIVNHGYVAETHHDLDPFTSSTCSITIAVRVNKPEFLFRVETASNRRCYFKTKAEIISDYSSQRDGVNLVISLSGLHSALYDDGLSSQKSKPYIILKPCDVELSKNVSEERGEKIHLGVSAIHIKLCQRVYHALTDVLNDIAENFKAPIHEPSAFGAATIGIKPCEDLWEQKQLGEYNVPALHILEEEHHPEIKRPSLKTQELFTLPKLEVVLLLELEERPVMILRSTLELTAHDWSSFINTNCDVTLQVNYFNESNQHWEPLVDPVVIDENQYRPWELSVKLFQDKALPMRDEGQLLQKSASATATSRGKHQSSTEADDEEESGEEMVYVEPQNTSHARHGRVTASLSTFLEDSDSENEEGIERLTSAISDLFTGKWNESEESDCDQTSDEDAAANNPSPLNNNKKSSFDKSSDFKKATYILVDAKDHLNITITPTLVRLLSDLITTYSSKSITICNGSRELNLINDIGPQSKVELFETTEIEGESNSILISYKMFEKEESCPNSPEKCDYNSLNEFIDDRVEERDSYNDELEADLQSELNLAYDDFETIDSFDFTEKTGSELYEQINRFSMKIHVADFQSVQTSCPKRIFQKLIRLQSITKNQLYYIIASHNVNKYGWKLTISSPLQIRNETCFALSILYQPSVLQQLNLEPVGDVTNPFETTMRIAVLEPHEHYNVPLHIAYHCKLFVQPAYADGHQASDTGIWWRDFSTDLDTVRNIHCTPKANTPSPNNKPSIFALRVKLARNLTRTSIPSSTVPNYLVHLLPPLLLNNQLPYVVEIELEGRAPVVIEPGEESAVYTADVTVDVKMRVCVRCKRGSWSGQVNLTTHLEERILQLMAEAEVATEGEANAPLGIYLKTERSGSVTVFLYAPYWIVNKTGLPVFLRASGTNIVHQSTNDDILLFTYKRHGKHALNLKIYDSDWSNDFGVDSAGINGLVVCKDNERKKRYSVLLSVRLSYMCPKFTRVVTLLPNFLVENNTSKPIRFMEHNEKTDLWIDLKPNECITFWPETTSMQMYLKFKDSKIPSQAFHYALNHQTVLRMDKGGAVTVDITGGQSSSFRVCFKPFSVGDAPVTIKNMCSDLFLKIQQQGQNQVSLISPHKSMLYTWDDPTKPRELTWNVYNNKKPGFFVDIHKDSFGEEKIRLHTVTPSVLNPTTSLQHIATTPAEDSSSSSLSSSSEDSDSTTRTKTSSTTGKLLHKTRQRNKRRVDKLVIYWICCNVGLERTLFFTQTYEVYRHLLSVHLMQHCQWEVLVSLAGFDVGVFTPKSATSEHVTVSCNDTPAVWEVNVGHKWKTLPLELTAWIENKYRQKSSKKCHQLRDYIHVDFDRMFMLKPVFAELRRSYSPAVYARLRTGLTLLNSFYSTRQWYYGVTVQSVQVDNKLDRRDAVLLQALDTARSAGQSSSAVFEFNARVSECSSSLSDGVIRRVYEKVSVVIGDVWVNVQADVLSELQRLLVENWRSYKSDSAMLYRKDLVEIRSPVYNARNAANLYKSIAEDITMPSFTIHLNLSNKGVSATYNQRLNWPILLEYLFPMNKTPYLSTDAMKHKISGMQNVTIRGCCDEVLADMIFAHVNLQFLQQYYSQVLGLQVLVNPNSHAVFNSEGRPSNTELDKYSSEILFGSRCLLGHVNMSWAALEQCILEVFVSQTTENIQRILRQNISGISGTSAYYETSSSMVLSSPNVQQNITSFVRKFNPGAVMAANQLIARSYNGFQSDGEDFYRGTEKSILTRVMRYTDNKTNCIEIVVEVLRRAIDLGLPLKIHQRLGRYYNNHFGLMPMSAYRSIGQYLTENIGHARFCTDYFWSFGIVDNCGNTLIIITLEHVIRVNKCRLWGPWELEWSLELDEIISVPKVTKNELILNIRQGENDIHTDGKLTILGEKQPLSWLQEKIEQAILISMEEKSWTLT